MAELKPQEYTIKEYLELEQQALEKSEYSDGRIVAMSGGTIDHAFIISNTNRFLGNAVERKNLACAAASSELRLYIEASNSFVYPDGMLLCGEIEISKEDKNAVTNPTLIFEVLSPSTERYDRGDKFRKYCSLVSFREYILIDAKRPIVDVLYREGPGSWNMKTAIGLDQSIYIHTLDTDVPLSALYNNTIELGPAVFSDK